MRPTPCSARFGSILLLAGLILALALLAGPEARAEILRRFEEQSSSTRDRQVRIEDNGGFEGVTAGLDSRGFLQVRTDTGMRTVLSGTVRLK